MAIRVDAYTSGGMASGTLVRPGALRDALEDADELSLDGAAWQGLDDPAATPAGSLSIPSDDVLIAVGDDANGYLSGRDDGIAVPDARAFDPIASVLRPGDAILVKGSRAVGLEGIPDLIQKHSLAW